MDGMLCTWEPPVERREAGGLNELFPGTAQYWAQPRDCLERPLKTGGENTALTPIISLWPPASYTIREGKNILGFFSGFGPHLLDLRP